MTTEKLHEPIAPPNFKIIEQRAYSVNPGDYYLCVIRCEAIDKRDVRHPYVTWGFNKQTGGCFWGHYFKEELEAKYDFRTRGPKN